MTDGKKLANDITNYLNTFGDKSEEFNEAMSTEHRTLQQNFTRLALAWLEHVASDEYRTDGRNEASKVMCKDLKAGYRMVQAEKGYNEHTLELMSKLNGHLPSV